MAIENEKASFQVISLFRINLLCYDSLEARQTSPEATFAIEASHIMGFVINILVIFHKKQVEVIQIEGFHY